MPKLDLAHPALNDFKEIIQITESDYLHTLALSAHQHEESEEWNNTKIYNYHLRILENRNTGIETLELYANEIIPNLSFSDSLGSHATQSSLMAAYKDALHKHLWDRTDWLKHKARINRIAPSLPTDWLIELLYEPRPD